MNEAKHYPKHSAQDLGQDYMNHVMAMTSEGLHSKSDIAVQLAWRDAELRRLVAINAELEFALTGLLADIVEYQTINKLGGENNHWQVISRAALEKAKQ